MLWSSPTFTGYFLKFYFILLLYALVFLLWFLESAVQWVPHLQVAPNDALGMAHSYQKKAAVLCVKSLSAGWDGNIVSLCKCRCREYGFLSLLVAYYFWLHVLSQGIWTSASVMVHRSSGQPITRFCSNPGNQRMFPIWYTSSWQTGTFTIQWLWLGNTSCSLPVIISYSALWWILKSS
jgi:hypothetical protein